MGAAEQIIRLERVDAVAIITLDRPDKLNALSLAMLEDLSAALEAVGLSDARALLITGAGRAFCSGADLTGPDGKPDVPDDLGEILASHYTPLVERLFSLPLPVITAVNGAAAGGGCSLALCGDLIIAARSSYFAQTFANVGLVPDAGSSWILPRTIGRARAMEMFLLGDRIFAEQALNWGMINRVVEDTVLMAEALALAQRLARGPTRAMELTRHLARRAMEADLAEVLQLECEAQRIAGRTSDFKTAVAAFANRRKPSFDGC